MTALDFREALDRLGLGQYHDLFIQEAFDSWEVLADITEKDLDALGVKLGHRRILQRAITEYRNDRASSVPAVELPSGPTHRAAKSEGSISNVAVDVTVGSNAAPRVATTGTKRKYRRHPKPDENAPDRPPSAYVLFSNQVREHLKGKELSFTEIAKTVGERWQVLAPDDKATYESRSQAMKDHYYAQLAEYKKTQGYADYQQYLADFKAKHEPNNVKRLKEDRPASPERRSSDERLASSPDHRESSANSSELYYGDRRRSAFDTPQLLTRADWRQPTRPDNVSPDMPSGMLPPDNGLSPRHNKPAFASINAPHPNAPVPVHLNSSLRSSSSQSGSPMNDHPMAVSTSMAYGYHPMMSSTPQGSDSPPVNMSNTASRRPTLASENSLPSLRHSDSIGSSASAGSPINSSVPPATSAFSRVLPSRELPPLLQSRQSSLSQTLPPMKTPGSPGHYSPQGYSPPASGLATLLRAGEHLASNGTEPRIENYHDSRYP